MDFLNYRGLGRRWELKWVLNFWVLLFYCYVLERFMRVFFINVLSVLKKWFVFIGFFYKEEV